MKKSAFIGSALAAVLVSATMAIPAFAASNPADDASAYSYSTGRKNYESRMAEEHSWYDSEDDSVTAGYSFNAGSQAAQARNKAFAGMPAGDDVAKEDVEAWFGSNGIGGGAAWPNGQYEESAKTGYGFMTGQAANQERQASFSESK